MQKTKKKRVGLGINSKEWELEEPRTTKQLVLQSLF